MPFAEANITEIIAAIGALGTAAFALVDATKAYKGGVSNIGFDFIKTAVAPYEAALRLVDAKDPYATIHANWLNGVPKADQKATVKALIRLGLTPVTAPTLAKGAPGVDAATLQSAATKVATGADLTEPELQCSRSLSTRPSTLNSMRVLSGPSNRSRNTARVLAAAAAILLAVIGGWAIRGADATGIYWFSNDFWIAVLVGIAAVPLAPIVKDVTSGITSAINAFKSVRS